MPFENETSNAGRFYVKSTCSHHKTFWAYTQRAPLGMRELRISPSAEFAEAFDMSEIERIIQFIIQAFGHTVIAVECSSSTILTPAQRKLLNAE